MELTTFWAEHKKTIVTTATVVIVGLIVIKFFDVIFWGGLVVALSVAAVLGWNYLSKKHGGAQGVLDAFFKEMGVK